MHIVKVGPVKPSGAPGGLGWLCCLKSFCHDPYLLYFHQEVAHGGRHSLVARMHLLGGCLLTAVSEDFTNKLLVLAGFGEVGSASVPSHMERKCLVIRGFARFTVPPAVIEDVVGLFLSDAALEPHRSRRRLCIKINLAAGFGFS